MTTTNTKTIKSSGGDYTSLSAWEAGRQADLVSGDLIEVAECYDLGAADTTAVAINGWTTGASNYVSITVPTAQKHSGIRSTSKYRLAGDSAFSAMLTVQEEYVRIHGLQIRTTSTVNTPGLIFLNLGAGECRVSDVLVYDCNTSSSVGIRIQNCNNAQTITFTNCAVMRAGGDGCYADTAIVNWYNCCSVNNGGIGFRRGGGTTTVKNCYSGGNTGADYSGTISYVTCHSEDGTGTTTTTAFSTSSGAYFTNVTAGSEDLHIGSSSALKDAGTSLAGWVHPIGDVDVDGDARSTWDVGYDEIVGAARARLLTLLGAGT